LVSHWCVTSAAGEDVRLEGLREWNRRRAGGYHAVALATARARSARRAAM